jgi:Coenzyme PQQ synthesis protein D (PqqD)
MPEGTASRDVILTEMKDGTGVLLDLESKFYFTLNVTGVAVWKLLASGEAETAAELAARIARDFAALLAELGAEGLVRPRRPAP